MTATTRASIAAALSTVDDVQGYTERPTSPQAGDSWPLVSGIARAEGTHVFEWTWRIPVVLAGDVGKATDMFDELLPKVVDALQALVFVDSARPLTIPTEAGSLYGVEFIGRSE